MGTTAQKLQAIANSKAAIKAAIEAKGVSDVGNKLSDYATKIGQISGGGSSGDPRYEVDSQGKLVKKNFALNYFNDVTSISNGSLQYAYRGSNVTSVSFPNLTSVEFYGLFTAFTGCTSLTSVDLSSLSSVEDYGLFDSFRGCTSLTTVYLSSLSSAGGYGLSETFYGCTHLELVDFSKATAVPLLSNVNTFQNTNETFRIVVPNALYNQWITATNWSTFASHIEKAIKGLVFAANAVNSTISLDAVGNPPSLDLEYSTDGGTTFSTYTVGTTVTLANVGDTVMFKAGDNGNTSLATDASNYHKFTMTGSISLEDDISYLLNKNAVPATTALADYAFYGLFNGCSALQNAPKLPWTTMGEGCYGEMFKGCTSLTAATELPATTLDDYCYKEMFYGCSSLNYIPLYYTGNFSTTYFNDWVNGVAATGTLVYDGTDTTTGTSAIPTGWTVVEIPRPELCFTAREANSTVKMMKSGSAPTVSLEYSTDKSTWNSFVVGTTTVTLANIGDRMWLRAVSTNSAMSASYNYNYNYFVMTGQIEASGNINSLLNKNPDLVTQCPQNAYVYLFYNCTSLIDASQLKLASTSTSANAYGYMFYGCSNMTKGPEICATTLGNYSQERMFQNCSVMNELKVHYTGIFGSSVFTDWVSGVQTTSGTFYYNGSYTGRGTNAIPTGWTITPFAT